MRNVRESQIVAFFESISKFQYEMAVSQLNDHDGEDWWKELKLSFQLLASCESTYYEMTYLETKFVKGNVLYALYTKLSDAMMYHAEELGESVKRDTLKSNVVQSNARTGENERAMLFANLFEECARFFELRLQVIMIYQKLATEKPPFNYGEMIRVLEETRLEVEKMEHQHLKVLRANTLFELQCVIAGMKVQVEVSNMQLHLAITHLLTMKGIIKRWSALLEMMTIVDAGQESGTSDPIFELARQASAPTYAALNEPNVVTRPRRCTAANLPKSEGSTKRSHRRSVVRSSDPSLSFDLLHQKEVFSSLPLFRWTVRFYYSLLAKVTLYFNKTLLRFESARETIFYTGAENASGIKYPKYITQFLSKCNNGVKNVQDSVATVMILYQVETMNTSEPYFHQDGYYCPQFPMHANIQQPILDDFEDSNAYDASGYAPLTGIKSWPAVYLKPNHAKPTLHWPNIISLLQDNPDTTTMIYFYEKHLNTSYYLHPLDHHHAFVVILNEKRKSNDKSTLEFIHTMCHSLNHLDVFRK